MKPSPEQRATLRAARLAQARKDRRSWRYWVVLVLPVVVAIPLGYLTLMLLWWSAGFAPNGWFAWAFTALCLLATVLSVRAGMKAAIRRREAWLAGERASSGNGNAMCSAIALWMTAWSSIAATYVSNFGAASSHVGPRFASAMWRLLVHGGP